ncbi:hypothetical protein Tco_0099828 [Tanacetum coccineum]
MDECKKSKSKAYTSLNGPTRTYLIGLNMFLASKAYLGLFKLKNGFSKFKGVFGIRASVGLKEIIRGRTIDQSAGGKLRDRNVEESWALLEDLALYDNESWNDPRDFAKPVKAIALPQDVPNTSDRRLIELENQVQRLMEAHLAPTQPTQVNKITTSCEICSGLYDTQYCMKDPEQAFVEYASSRADEAGESIERFLNNFANQPNEANMNDLESDDESVYTHLISPFPHSDNDSDDGEVLNELIEYENVGILRRKKAINSFDGDDLAF